MINPDSRNSKNHVIEMLRFGAAMCVVFVHIPIIGVGRFGVDIFFIVSGFVMMLSTRHNTRNFFLKRLIRIVPTYYFFTIGVFSISLLFPSLLNSTSANFIHLLKSLAFIPFDKNGTGHFPVLFLGWTLNYEMFFYLLFAIALQLSQQYRGAIVSLMIVAVTIIAGFSDTFIANVYGDPIVFEFSLGVLLYLLLHNGSAIQITMVLVSVLFGGFLAGTTIDHRLVQFGIPAFISVFIALRFFGGSKVPRLFTILGGASYALYLTHPYVIQFIEKITDLFHGPVWEQVIATIVAIVAVNILAIIVYTYLEKPVCAYLRDRMMKVRPKAKTR